MTNGFVWFSFLHLAFWGLYGWFVGEAGQGFVAFCCMVSAKCSLVFSVEPVASQSGRDLTSQVVLTSHSALLCWTFVGLCALRLVCLIGQLRRTTGNALWQRCQRFAAAAFPGAASVGKSVVASSGLLHSALHGRILCLRP